MNKKRKKETGRGGGFSDGNRAGGGFGNSRGSGFGDGNRARGGFSSSRGGGFGDGNRAGGGFSSSRGGGFGDSNRNGFDNSFFGAHEPQKKDDPVEWAWHVAGSAAKSNISKVGNLLTDLYSWNQDGRDRENQENLSEAKINLYRAERDLAAMESTPDKWDKSSIQSQRYVVEDARRKYEAYAKVLHENVQKKTTQSSYKLFDQLAASASKDVRDAKRGQSDLVQKLTDMAAAAGEEAPDLFLVGLMGVSEAIPYLLRNFTEGSREARQKGGGTREQILHGAKQAGIALAADQLGKALQQIKSGNLLDDLPLNREGGREGGLPRLGEPSMTPVDLGKFPLSKRKSPMEGHKDTDPHLLDFAQFQERYLSKVSRHVGVERMKAEYDRFLHDMKPNDPEFELVPERNMRKKGGEIQPFKAGKVMLEEGKTEGYNKNEPYFSTYEERGSKTPRGDNGRGCWTGERGKSKFIPSDEEVTQILNSFELDGIQYHDNIPDFSPCSAGTVEIENMTDDRKRNYAQCDERCAELWNMKKIGGRIDWTPEKVEEWRGKNRYTWHERNDMKTCDLVPREINRYFNHYGGVGEYNKMNREKILGG